MASGEYYRSGQSSKPVEESNGLLYALTYAPKLSDKYTTGEAREAWGNGEFVGHPIMVMDGKSENTKFVGEVRETMSFCDTGREVLSECDSNFSVLAGYIEGVSSRAGSRSVGGIL